MSHELIIDLYEQYATQYDANRGKNLQEKAWLDAFLHEVPAGGTVLDIGCGSGEPIAKYVLQQQYNVVGIDTSPSMIAMCRKRFPQAVWHIGDMRTLSSVLRNETYDGIIAWDSLFHLKSADQQLVLKQFARYIRPGSPLLFTSGPAAGVSIGEWQGKPLYHASLSPQQYESILREHGFTVRDYVAQDSACGDHTVWLAVFR